MCEKRANSEHAPRPRQLGVSGYMSMEYRLRSRRMTMSEGSSSSSSVSFGPMTPGSMLQCAGRSSVTVGVFLNMPSIVVRISPKSTLSDEERAPTNPGRGSKQIVEGARVWTICLHPLAALPANEFEDASCGIRASAFCPASRPHPQHIHQTAAVRADKDARAAEQAQLLCGRHRVAGMWMLLGLHAVEHDEALASRPVLHARHDQVLDRLVMMSAEDSTLQCDDARGAPRIINDRGPGVNLAGRCGVEPHSCVRHARDQRRQLNGVWSRNACLE
eukprot:scaffold454_cov124-Isochrysis_galbana.AAC.19